jgi:hypothetical protein
MTLDVQRLPNATIVRFEPSQLVLVARPAGGGPNRAQPLRASDVMRDHPDLLAVINGPMFSICRTEQRQPNESDPHFYARVKCEVLDYRMYNDDVEYPAQAPGRFATHGATISLVNQDTRLVPLLRRGNKIPDGDVTLAIQGDPALVIRNSAQGIGEDPGIKWRSAFAITKDRRLAFVEAQMGMQTLQRLCMDQELPDVVYLDGGGSGRLAFRDGTWIGNRENRPVASWLGIRPDLGWLDGPPRGSKVPWMVGGAALVLGLWAGFHGQS